MRDNAHYAYERIDEEEHDSGSDDESDESPDNTKAESRELAGSPPSGQQGKIGSSPVKDLIIDEPNVVTSPIANPFGVTTKDKKKKKKQKSTKKSKKKDDVAVAGCDQATGDSNVKKSPK